jgi:circadian clock protein KaiB
LRTTLRLFVTGTSSRSERAITSLRALCDDRLGSDYDLEVIDVIVSPQEAEDHKIIATPTLIRVAPEPVRRIIGDLSDGDRVAFGLDLPLAGG